MHSWLAQSEAVVQASPTVAPHPVSRSAKAIAGPMVRLNTFRSPK
jgi:hypothetical protein